MEDGKLKTKLCTEGATHDQSNDPETFNPLKLF
jgi:hypothetical protein